jgi:hypothetical protein
MLEVLLVDVLWYLCISIIVFSLDVDFARYILYDGNCFFDCLSLFILIILLSAVAYYFLLFHFKLVCNLGLLSERI